MIQSLALVAVRRQPDGDAVMVNELFVAPFAEGCAEAGESVTDVQIGATAPAGCVTVNVAFPTVMCPVRTDEVLFAAMW